MTTKAEQTPESPSKLAHETIDKLSSIVSIAQFALISEDLSPKLQEDLKRIIQAAHSAAEHINDLSDMLRAGD
jgi:signal transduction histidine kinase